MGDVEWPVVTDIVTSDILKQNNSLYKHTCVDLLLKQFKNIDAGSELIAKLKKERDVLVQEHITEMQQ